MKKRSLSLSVTSILLMCTFVFAETQAQKPLQKIIRGKRVSIEYRLRLADGTVVDNNVGKAPLSYIQGAKQIIPGLERQLEGLKPGDAKKVEVAPKEGYGEYNPAAIQEISKGLINSQDLNLGAKLYSQDSYGRMVTATIKEIKKDTVLIDMNNPLAGKTLYFDVKVLSVEDVGQGQSPTGAR